MRKQEVGSVVLYDSQTSGEQNEVRYVYRGIDGEHPQITTARAGIVVPGNIEGTVSALQHNDGGLEYDSPYTSWTHSLRIAREFARRVPGGVVLRLPSGKPNLGERWHWEWSPDVYGEFEVLLYGVRMDAEVIE
jgi:hypothetical protein